jgi:hypothetical protein
LPETQSELWQVYPNPGTGRFLLRGMETTTLSVTDAEGRTQVRPLSRMEDQVHELDITDMPAGVYYLHQKENGNRRVKRIVKIK